jgi:hypothetical protein
MKNLTIAGMTIIMAAQCLLAGPPMICHPYITGNEPSLPWGSDKSVWSAVDPKYDTANLAVDTMKLLDSGLPMLTRMETLRRAAVYTSKNSAAGLDLVSRLIARALEAEVKGQTNSLALFDAGFFVESMKQLGQASKTNVYITVDGYDWAKRSVPGLQDKLAAEFALGLMQSYTSWPNEHVRRAVAGAHEGSLLAQNLVARFDRGSLTEVRKLLGAKYASR